MIGVIVALICFGIILEGIEFIVPGGVIGLIGIMCMIAAVVVTFIEHGAMAGFLVAALVVVVTISFIATWMKYFHRTPFGRIFMLETEVGGGGSERAAAKAPLLGKTGVAKSHLRPSGTAVIDGQRVDVVAETGMIEPGEPIEVVRVEGFRVVVRKAASAEGEPAAAAGAPE